MIKLVSLNIELNKHFSLNLPFLKSENPDVFCAQEVYKKDIQYIKDILGFEYVVFAPMFSLPYFKLENPESFPDIYGIANDIAAGKDSKDYEFSEAGIAIFSRFEFTEEILIDYFNPLSDGKVQLHDANRREQTVAGPVISVSVTPDGEEYTIVNTHFTWCGKGEHNSFQAADVETMLGILSKIEGCVFCGDFNAPRGGVIFDRVAEVYKDNIPVECTSTIDPNKHRAGKIDYVVDGLFSTPEYVVSGVKVCEGVSDHKAVVATIGKIN